MLDTARRLFIAHGVHAVGMDRLITESGLGKMSVYRLFPTKDELVGAHLRRLAGEILSLIDEAVQQADGPRSALYAILDGIEVDLRRADFRGCPFGNAAAEYDDPAHPARVVAHDYRLALLHRLEQVAARLGREQGRQLAQRLAVIIDGAYLNAAHLGPDGPAAEGLKLGRYLIDMCAPSAPW